MGFVRAGLNVPCVEIVSKFSRKKLFRFRIFSNFTKTEKVFAHGGKNTNI